MHNDIVIRHVDNIPHVPRVVGSGCQETVALVVLLPKIWNIEAQNVFHAWEELLESCGRKDYTTLKEELNFKLASAATIFRAQYRCI
jgi:hypothetical protein